MSESNICLITPDNLKHFSSFLLPGARRLMEKGEPVTALGYVDKDTACGAICGMLTGRRFKITSLYVSPEKRQDGIGGELLLMIKVLVKPFSDVITTDFTVTEEEHIWLCKMLEIYGFKRRSPVGSAVYKTTVANLLEGGLFERDFGEDLFPSFSDVDKSMLLEAEKIATERGLPIPEKGFLCPSVDMHCSTIQMRKDDLKAYVAVEENHDGSLLISGVSNCTDNPMIVMKILHDAALKASQSYPYETKVFMQAVNEESKKLIGTLDPKAEAVDVHYELI